MDKIPAHFQDYLSARKESNAYRQLKNYPEGLIDFSSNDYLGFAQSIELSKDIQKNYQDLQFLNNNGSGGARLLSGNTEYYLQIELLIASYHKTKFALLFPSGYQANVGVLSAIATKDDVLLYDENIHSSLRDGIRLSLAKSYSFKHNNIKDCNRLIQNNPSAKNIFIVVEGLYSMDGDFANIQEFVQLKNQYPTVYLIIDEAHSGGICGKDLVQLNGFENDFLIRIYPLGKAFGISGASVVCQNKWIYDYLINFCRTFIYTTAPSIHQWVSVASAYHKMNNHDKVIKQLIDNINLFNTLSNEAELQVQSDEKSPIKSVIIKGNKEVKKASEELINNGYLVFPILSPTVKAGTERLRINIHSFNTQGEIIGLVSQLKQITHG